jgi:hypothetical protein
MTDTAPAQISPELTRWRTNASGGSPPTKRPLITGKARA